MLLLQMLMFTLVDFSSSWEHQSRCYGSTYSFSPPQIPNSIYYMPRTSDERILVIENRKSKHERFDVTSRNITIIDLTDEDDQAVLFFDQENSVRLGIKDCTDPQRNTYGEEFTMRVPSSAEYLQFSQVVPYESTHQPVVIWNHTDPSLRRRSVKNGYYEIKNAKQTNSGYYKFRNLQNRLLNWKRLEVEEVDFHFEVTEGDRIDQQLPPGFSFERMIYTPDGSTQEIWMEKDWSPTVFFHEGYFTISDIGDYDSGIYKFVDEDGNIAARIQLEVKTVNIIIWENYVFAVAIVVIGIIIICCCVKKCCCKKDKRNIPDSTTAQPAAAAPAVFYHESNQSAPPAIPLLSREPVRYMADLTTNVVGGMDPPQFTQATVPVGPGPTSGTNADFEPKFVVKGSVAPSAPPLSADSSIRDVYTSDKLNFL